MPLLEKRTWRGHRKILFPLYSCGFFIITNGSLIFTAQFLEIGLTTNPIPFMKTLTPYTSHFLTLLSIPSCHPSVFLVSESSYKQPFGNNFEARLLSCTPVYCSLEVRDRVFSTCHVYASYSVGT